MHFGVGVERLGRWNDGVVVAESFGGTDGSLELDISNVFDLSDKCEGNKPVLLGPPGLAELGCLFTLFISLKLILLRMLP